MERKVETICLECGSKVTLDFTGLDYQQALEAIEKMDRRNYECPGWHVEIGGWKKMWQLVDAVEKAYTPNEKALSKAR